MKTHYRILCAFLLHKETKETREREKKKRERERYGRRDREEEEEEEEEEREREREREKRQKHKPNQRSATRLNVRHRIDPHQHPLEREREKKREEMNVRGAVISRSKVAAVCGSDLKKSIRFAQRTSVSHRQRFANLRNFAADISDSVSARERPKGGEKVPFRQPFTLRGTPSDTNFFLSFFFPSLVLNLFFTSFPIFRSTRTPLPPGSGQPTGVLQVMKTWVNTMLVES